jgi:hypothetical protein
VVARPLTRSRARRLYGASAAAGRSFAISVDSGWSAPTAAPTIAPGRPRTPDKRERAFSGSWMSPAFVYTKPSVSELDSEFVRTRLY